GKLESFSMTDFGVVKVDDKVEGSKKALEAVAKRLLTKDVNISVSGPNAIVRYIELPNMTDEELKSSMKFEAEKYIPFRSKDVIVDCQVLEKLARGKMRVLLAAAKKEAITEKINLVEGVGLSVNLIDCDSFALINTFLLNFPDLPEDGCIALVNMGERLTTIDILKGKSATFTRELQIGGWDFSKAISQKLNLDMAAAVQVMENPQARLEELMGAVRPTIVHIVEEVKLSLSYYENQMGAVVDKIYLSGGLSFFHGLVDILKEGIGMECFLWDPVKRITIDKGVDQEKLSKIKHQLPVALGLAIRG
ncbi:MAG: type IV pilus assembly protein PilM, partial [Candidatus Omnitrophota bacterium]